jgi:uncharacterized membrane protein HdeD (DUF308 family)
VASSHEQFPMWFLISIAGLFAVVWAVVTVFAVLVGRVTLGELLPLHLIMGGLIGSLYGFAAAISKRNGGNP